MNTMTFIFGQLLTLEMRAAGRTARRQRLQDRLRQNRLTPRLRSTHGPKGVFMDTNILVIAFLIVTLIANFAMPARHE